MGIYPALEILKNPINADIIIIGILYCSNFFL